MAAVAFAHGRRAGKEMNGPTANENATCDECGRYDAIDFGERKLCPNCYESYGSCCSTGRQRSKRAIVYFLN